MSLPMKEIEGVPNKDQIKPGMAFFSGTGPFGAKCGSCKHRGYHRKGPERFVPETGGYTQRTYKVQACQKFKEMAGRHGSDVDAMWDACKYYEAKK